MMTYLNVECKKARHRKLPLLVVGLLFVLFIWSFWALHDSSVEELKSGYYGLLYQLPLMNTILLPLFVAVLASRIWDTENKGNTYKLLCTLEPKKSIYLWKTIYGILYLLIFSVAEVLLMVLLGNVIGFTQTLPLKHLVAMVISTFAVSFLFLLIQQTVTFLYENQFIALSLGLIGSFFGLFTLFFPKQFANYVIWAYYGVFQTVGMNWDRETRECSYYTVPYSFNMLFIVIVLIIACFLIGRALFLRKDV